MTVCDSCGHLCAYSCHTHGHAEFDRDPRVDAGSRPEVCTSRIIDSAYLAPDHPVLSWTPPGPRFRSGARVCELRVEPVEHALVEQRAIAHLAMRRGALGR